MPLIALIVGVSILLMNEREYLKEGIKMTREEAIDANELMVEIQVCSWDSEQDKERAEDLVLGMPTLTPRTSR